MGRHRFLFSRDRLAIRLILLSIVISSIDLSGSSAALAFSDGLLASSVIDSSVPTPTVVSASLSPGATYRLAASGTYARNAAGDIQDAECSGGLPRRPSASLDDLGDLYIDGSQIDWKPLIAAGPLGVCSVSSSSIYTASYVPSSATMTAFVNDDSYSDNSGSLYLRVLCLPTFPSGEVFVQQAAINPFASETVTETATSCPFGSEFDPTSFKLAQTTSAAIRDGYGCSKRARYHDIADQAESFGYLQTATALIDSRDNSFYDPLDPADPNSVHRGYDATDTYYSETETAWAWRYSGHWGIHTCNWLEPGVNYRITVKGTYKYDQSVTGTSYAMADAECATGYRQSTASTPGITTTSTSETWSDKEIPSYYLYQFTDRGMTPDKFGAGWQDHRFDYHPKEAEGFVTSTYDGLDLQFGWQGQSQFVTWTVVTQSAGAWVTTTSTSCSDLHHAYLAEVTGTGNPLHMVIHDFYRYQEWDNCGALSVRISTDTSSIILPSEPPSIDCHYAPINDALIVTMSAAAEPDPMDPLKGYFGPPTSVVVEESFRMQASYVTQAVTSSVIYWRLVSGSHWIASALDKRGKFCTGIYFNDDPDPTRKGYFDRCDATTATADERHLFEFKPEDIAGSQGQVHWNIFENLSTTTVYSDFCSDGYCSIPYYCRIHNESSNMRGVIVVRQTASLSSS